MVVASSSGAGYNHTYAGFPRWFGLTEGREPAPLGAQNRVASNTRARGDQECTPDVQAERDACPQCEFPHADPSGNRGHDGPAIVNTRAVGLSYPLHAAAFATFSPSSTPRSICWASSCGDA